MFFFKKKKNRKHLDAGLKILLKLATVVYFYESCFLGLFHKDKLYRQLPVETFQLNSLSIHSFVSIFK